MENYSMVLTIIIAILAAILLLVNVERLYVRLFKKPFFVHIPFGRSPLSKKWKNYIAQHNLFYAKLTPREQTSFDLRLVSFIKKHEFIGHQVDITKEKKVLISTIPVMLTFGMRNYLFDSIDRILIYPNQYFSTITQRYHKGELNPAAKMVVLSWEHFEEGIKIVDDNLNLGIHEFAHALFFSCKRKNSASCQLFTFQFMQLLKTLSQADIKKRVIDLGYFRDYAFEDQYEFIAVVFECFFETPLVFKEKLPELYMHVKNMLNIDIEQVYSRTELTQAV
jgi:hypothetical protein